MADFETKKELAAHLLKKGVTAKEMLKALGWTAISMPRLAKSLGMKLEKTKEGRVTKFKGIALEAATAESAEVEDVEQIETSSNLTGMARKSLDLIEAMAGIVAAAKPITGRGVGYKLFTAGLIPSMAKSEMQRVYRLLTEARERGMIPWDGIVDETRELESVASWSDPESYSRAVIRSYRRDYWSQQPVRVEVWSEKGTVRGVLRPVLDEYGVGFRVLHGFSSATAVYDAARFDDGRSLMALYVGDWDPSGLCMSERDLPERLSRYDGDHVTLQRIALRRDDLRGIPSFPVTDKAKDPRYAWFVKKFGRRCWELDAMDPNALRDRVERGIVSLIEPTAWERCKVVERAEQESLREVMASWGPTTPKPKRRKYSRHRRPANKQQEDEAND